MTDIPADSAILDAVMKATSDAVIVSDDAGKILRSNAVAERFFQAGTGELLGQDISTLIPGAPQLFQSFETADHPSGAGRNGTGRDVEGRRKDGTLLPLHLSVGKTQADGIQAYVAILHDLTQRRTTEQALARSQRMDAIGQMTGGIAHDFNNLLTVIIGNLELLEMRGANDRQLPLIQDALGSAELGADLTSRLMVFARRSDLKPVSADLRDLCVDTLKLLGRTLGSSFRIKTDFASDVDPVMIDPSQFQSTLMNLALNARDAMGTGGELLVSIANVTIDDTYMAQETDITPGRYVRLSVSDDGAGMSLEAQRRAFEPFFTTKAKSGGTGLGLAMVYGFVRQSGGHVTLYSELGLGTSFGLYFPAHLQAGGQDDPGTAPADARRNTPLGNGEVILIVEDNPIVRKLSIERIRDLGFETLEAESGDQAYQMLKDGAEADVVFSDLVMPGRLNGYDLAELVHREFPKLKVLLTSGYASDVVTGSMSHGQPFDILHKPYRQAELVKRLSALLAEAPGP